MNRVPSPPRQVIAVRPKPIIKAFVRTIVFAVIAATFLLAIVLINELLLKWAGREVVGAVSLVLERPDRSGGFEHVAYYTYSYPGEGPREDHSLINWDAYHRLKRPFVSAVGRPDDLRFPVDAPGQLAIRAYRIGPLRYSRAVEHEWGSILLVVSGVLLPAGMLLSFTLYLAAIVRPRQQRELYVSGTAVEGITTDKNRMTTKGGYVYILRYTFTPAKQGMTPYSTSMMLAREEFEAAQPGQAVTILYDPMKPKRSTIYEYGGYRFV